MYMYRGRMGFILLRFKIYLRRHYMLSTLHRCCETSTSIQQRLISITMLISSILNGAHRWVVLSPLFMGRKLSSASHGRKISQMGKNTISENYFTAILTQATVFANYTSYFLVQNKWLNHVPRKTLYDVFFVLLHLLEPLSLWMTRMTTTETSSRLFRSEFEFCTGFIRLAALFLP